MVQQISAFSELCFSLTVVYLSVKLYDKEKCITFQWWALIYMTYIQSDFQSTSRRLAMPTATGAIWSSESCQWLSNMLNGDQTSDPPTGRCLFTPWDTAALCFCIHPFFLLLSLCRRVVVKINWLQVIRPRPDPVESVCRPSPKAVKAKSRQSTYTHS